MIKRRPPVPISGVVYGEIIYWCTCLSALLVVGGTIISFLETDSVMPAGYLINSVFEGRSVEEIWATSVLKSPPDALTYLSLLRYGEALTVAGIAFGVLSVAPAVFFSAAYLWRSKNEFLAVTAMVSGAFAIITPFVYFLF
ncbi:hypothetical protein N9X93_04805 [Alphaproteobacteria bacterium]|jgi:hypothetical protein|nr:hypothetical protein [Alphaproteobacteria bacterium]